MNRRKIKSRKKIKVLEDNNLNLYGKVAILEKKINKQERYSIYTWIFLHDIPLRVFEVMDDIAIKIICENMKYNIVTVDDIHRSQRIEKYNSQKQNLRLVVVKFVRHSTWDTASFSHKCKLKGRQKSISKSLAKLYLMKLKEATIVCKIVF